MAKDEGKEDIEFNRAELDVVEDDKAASIAREKRNSPMPEQYRENQDGLGDWPVHEGRKPAAMRADTKESLEYKVETLEKVDEKDRAKELAGLTGDVARDAARAAAREGNAGNDFQAPPTVAAQEAADGNGMISDPVPVVDNPRAATTAAKSAAAPAKK